MCQPKAIVLCVDSLQAGVSQTDISGSVSLRNALADLLRIVGRSQDAMELYTEALRSDCQ